jgi:hypothetical protein
MNVSSEEGYLTLDMFFLRLDSFRVRVVYYTIFWEIGS